MERLLRGGSERQLSVTEQVFSSFVGGAVSGVCTLPMDVLVSTFQQASKAGQVCEQLFPNCQCGENVWSHLSLHEISVSLCVRGVDVSVCCLQAVSVVATVRGLASGGVGKLMEFSTRGYVLILAVWFASNQRVVWSSPQAGAPHSSRGIHDCDDENRDQPRV